MCILCVFFCFILHSCIIVSMVGWTWWHWSLILIVPIFLQCFDTVGWVIWPVKPVPNMTYNVFGGTSNLALPILPWGRRVVLTQATLCRISTWRNQSRYKCRRDAFSCQPGTPACMPATAALYKTSSRRHNEPTNKNADLRQGESVPYPESISGLWIRMTSRI